MLSVLGKQVNFGILALTEAPTVIVGWKQLKSRTVCQEFIFLARPS